MSDVSEEGDGGGDCVMLTWAGVMVWLQWRALEVHFPVEVGELDLEGKKSEDGKAMERERKEEKKLYRSRKKNL